MILYSLQDNEGHPVFKPFTSDNRSKVAFLLSENVSKEKKGLAYFSLLWQESHHVRLFLSLSSVPVNFDFGPDVEWPFQNATTFRQYTDTFVRVEINATFDSHLVNDKKSEVKLSVSVRIRALVNVRDSNVNFEMILV